MLRVGTDQHLQRRGSQVCVVSNPFEKSGFRQYVRPFGWPTSGIMVSGDWDHGIPKPIPHKPAARPHPNAQSSKSATRGVRLALWRAPSNPLRLRPVAFRHAWRGRL